MPRYEYVCPECDHYYIEQRPVEDSQYFTTCQDCGKAEYQEKQ